MVSFCVASAALVGVLFGLAPAWQSRDLTVAARLGADSRTTTRRGGGLRKALVAAEVAMAVLLLFGAGLLLRTLLAVDGVDRGYRAEARADDDGRSIGQPVPDRLNHCFNFSKPSIGRCGRFPA